MRTISIAILTLAISACSVEPEPLIYGKDQCYSCKMTLVDQKFGAELVTSKGKIYKFDDINCLFNFYNEGIINKDEYLFKLVVDFSKPEKLINAETARYLKSGEIKSPMASQVAAFESADPDQKAAWKATEHGWSELQARFNK